ncbi:receptor activity-modifying protein 2-like isoform X3 [Sander lucioperca]|uniref:receptor activity-modifying protein 2-like isoform X3 n=1 Tax=Sander lucioperca TaxID=283035 RepID=UPI00125E9D9B|nr:receptor activity-modifying protein 2-like isoform X3 [Sander lucioperca]
MTSQVTERPRRLLPIPSSLTTMILYLLVPVLILGGNVESQTANRTEEELSKVEGNQTLREPPANNSALKPDNMTSLYKDEKGLIEDELQNNQTSGVITEDDERFQDQEKEFATLCNVDMLEEYSHLICGEVFHAEMTLISTENWCVLRDVIRPYNNMTVCLERLSNLIGCYYPNPTIQDFFLNIHSKYFLNCSKEEDLLVDAPQGMVIALTLIPVSLIPLLVYVVVWKSNVQE